MKKTSLLKNKPISKKTDVKKHITEIKDSIQITDKFKVINFEDIKQQYFKENIDYIPELYALIIKTDLLVYFSHPMFIGTLIKKVHDFRLEIVTYTKIYKLKQDKNNSFSQWLTSVQYGFDNVQKTHESLKRETYIIRNINSHLCPGISLP